MKCTKNVKKWSICSSMTTTLTSIIFTCSEDSWIYRMKNMLHTKVMKKKPSILSQFLRMPNLRSQKKINRSTKLPGQIVRTLMVPPWLPQVLDFSFQSASVGELKKKKLKVASLTLPVSRPRLHALIKGATLWHPTHTLAWIKRMGLRGAKCPSDATFWISMKMLKVSMELAWPVQTMQVATNSSHNLSFKNSQTMWCPWTNSKISSDWSAIRIKVYKKSSNRLLPNQQHNSSNRTTTKRRRSIQLLKKRTTLTKRRKSENKITERFKRWWYAFITKRQLL